MVKCESCGSKVGQAKIKGKKCKICDPEIHGAQKVGVYVNELLSYVWHYYKSSSKVCIRTYLVSYSLYPARHG